MDRAVVQGKLDFIEHETGQAARQGVALRALGDTTDPEGDIRAGLLRGVKYSLQTSIQAMIDIAYHIAAKDFGVAPSDAYEAFEVLSRHRVIPPARRTVYRGMIGFRNVVVHGYAEVDDGRALAMLDRLDDFDMFRREIASYGKPRASEAVTGGPSGTEPEPEPDGTATER